MGEVILVLFVSELLAGGGQAPVNSAMAGLSTVLDDIPGDIPEETVGDAVTGAAGVVRG